MGYPKWVIVANTFIRKSTLTINLVLLSSSYDDLELSPVFWGRPHGRRLSMRVSHPKNGLLKTLNFTCQKISALALHRESLELGPASSVYLENLTEK